jgi:hypothetical protein
MNDLETRFADAATRMYLKGYTVLRTDGPEYRVWNAVLQTWETLPVPSRMPAMSALCQMESDGGATVDADNRVSVCHEDGEVTYWIVTEIEDSHLTLTGLDRKDV